MTPHAWMRAVRGGSGLPPTVRLVAWAIGMRADRSGNCWPTYGRIAEDTGLHRVTVIRAMKELADGGWVHVVARANGHGDQSNSYLLTTPQLSTGGSTGLPPPVAQDYPGVAQDYPLGGSTGLPRSSSSNEVMPDNRSAAVDNRHLGSVIDAVSRRLRIPPSSTPMPANFWQQVQDSSTEQDLTDEERRSRQAHPAGKGRR